MVANNSNMIKEMEEKAEIRGKVESLIRLLTKKFSVVSEKYEENIKKLSEETINQITIDIFDINSLSELDKYFE
ncbi:DUF4351 domain-containing protein [Clostridium gasigenes]|uniref:DUF4351 domain-containing protein n=1 Tax=Clostridium gasigenes TaxID=94869 RepID=UPI0016238964|nr:DUF4351 domain-containing protein [Clostridium gasigenes]MBB6625285.1 DUF4351 domain-containing protein [Clostridium gasigenes]